MRRVPPPASASARVAGLGGLALLALGCTETLDAGHNRPPDPCAIKDGGVPGCPPPGLLDNLVGYWRLDDGAGSTVAFDSSGRGNDGKLHQLDPGSAWVTGRAQGALDIGHAGWVQVAASPSIDSLTDHVTVAAWVNLEGTITSDDGWATALSRQIGTSTNQHYHLSINVDGRPSLFFITATGFSLIKADDAPPKNTWTHLAGTYDGETSRLYVDGVEAKTGAVSGSFAADTTPIILGGNGNDASGVPTELFPGRLDELMLYGRALSAAEIAQLAAGALFPAGARDAGTD